MAETVALLLLAAATGAVAFWLWRAGELDLGSLAVGWGVYGMLGAIAVTVWVTLAARSRPHWRRGVTIVARRVLGGIVSVTWLLTGLIVAGSLRHEEAALAVVCLLGAFGFVIGDHLFARALPDAAEEAKAEDAPAPRHPWFDRLNLSVVVGICIFFAASAATVDLPRWTSWWMLLLAPLLLARVLLTRLRRPARAVAKDGAVIAPINGLAPSTPEPQPVMDRLIAVVWTIFGFATLAAIAAHFWQARDWMRAGATLIMLAFAVVGVVQAAQRWLAARRAPPAPA